MKTATGLSGTARDVDLSTDDREIHALLCRLYEVISFEEEGEPDWNGMNALFSSHARITKVTPEAIDYHTLADFQDTVRELLDLGAYMSFYEHEVRRSVARFGGMAHVLSAYESRRSPTAAEPFARGINSLQLIREDGEWRVLSLFWDEETERNPLDLDAIFGKA